MDHKKESNLQIDLEYSRGKVPSELLIRLKQRNRQIFFFLYSFLQLKDLKQSYLSIKTFISNLGMPSIKKTGNFMTLCKIHLIPTYPT